MSSIFFSSIKTILTSALRHKFQTYNPEPAHMPFHTRLLGKDRLALFSFIHSLNTNFGTSIFEPVALELAKSNFKTAESQKIAGSIISEESQKVIQNMMDSLTSAQTKPNKKDEINLIRKVAQKGTMKTIKPTKVDIFLTSHNDEFFLFDLKTAKPNKGGFREYKRTLLEWVACILTQNPKATINTLIAIPYNPYHPKPYSRWTMAGMLDLDEELKVAEEFWDFLGGRGSYEKLLDVFERVGIELRDEMNEYFTKYLTKGKPIV